MTVNEAIAHLTSLQHELRKRQHRGPWDPPNEPPVERLVLEDGSPIGCFGISPDGDKVYVYAYDASPIPELLGDC
jgi:hypothetical protein